METDVMKEIEVYRNQGFNVLMPSIKIEGLSEWHAPVIEQVKLSKIPDDGDVYPAEGKVRLTKQALMKLSVCAGIIWSPTESKRIDNRGDRNYIAYQAVGGIRKPDGTPVFFKAEYDIDFEVIKEELRELYEKKARDLKDNHGNPKTSEQKAGYVSFCVKRDMLQKRKHGLKLAEAGAMNRVVREVLSLKNAYKPEEIDKPFVVARIVFRPDYSDKEVRAKLIDASIRAMTGIYGEQAISRVPPATEPIDITPLDDEPKAEDESGPTFISGDDPVNGALADFQNSDPDGQHLAIRNLADQKGYDLKDYLARSGKKSIVELPAEKRLSLFQHLLTRPASKKEEAQDDIPF